MPLFFASRFLNKHFYVPLVNVLVLGACIVYLSLAICGR
jgi:hypothetical protein